MTNPALATDFWNEQCIHIEGNPLLENIANHILQLISKDPALQGKDKETMAMIDRRLAISIWMDEGLWRFVPEDKREGFFNWFTSTKTCSDYEAITRARRLLQDKGHFRPPANAVVMAERHRQRISRSVKA